tara:strand:- start:1967 stop:2833 length:867 start_codon:yes stop_codon:yes gene_type:complete
MDNNIYFYNEKIKINDLSEIYKTRLQEATFYKINFELKNVKEEFYSLIFLAYLSDISAIGIKFDLDLINTFKKYIKSAYIKSRQFNSLIIEKMLLFVSLQSSEFSGTEISKLVSRLNILNEQNIDVLELHIDNFSIDCIEKQLYIIHTNFHKKIISLNVSRKKLSNANIVEIIKLASSIMKDQFFVEVDGVSNKVKNSFNNTLQSISTADIINKELKFNNPRFNKFPLLISGGTNSLTKSLANQCNVPFNGITINETYLSNLKNHMNIIEDKEEILFEAISSLKNIFK